MPRRGVLCVRLCFPQVNVPVVSIKSVVEYLFATPTMRRELVFGRANSPDREVREFNQSDLVANAYKYQRSMPSVLCRIPLLLYSFL